MKLISWNIQWACGVDGQVSVDRIIQDAQSMGDFDVLCLQEVANNFPELTGQPTGNQFEQFAEKLPGFTSIPHYAVDIHDNQQQRTFGNLILTRYPVLRVIRHQLPWPCDTAVISMPRVLTEVTLDTPFGPVRVMNTHLEFHSKQQRQAQVAAIRHIHKESCLRAKQHFVKDVFNTPYRDVAQTTKTIIVGDFNMPLEDQLYQDIQLPFKQQVPRLVDAWAHLYPEQPHPDTVGIYDHVQWAKNFTCDFMFTSETLLPHLTSYTGNTTSQSSDHQPQLIEMA